MQLYQSPVQSQSQGTKILLYQITHLYEVHESPVPGVALGLGEGNNGPGLEVKLLPVVNNKAFVLLCVP